MKSRFQHIFQILLLGGLAVGASSNTIAQVCTSISSNTNTPFSFTSNNECLEITASGSIGQSVSPLASDAVINGGYSGLRISNTGNIYVVGWSGIVNLIGGTITTLNNSITGTISAGDAGTGIANFSSTITTLNNLGTILSGNGGTGIFNDTGTIGTLNNSGSISVGNGSAGILNHTGSTISTLNNTGSIAASDGGFGIVNSGGGTIDTLNNSNTGTISGGLAAISNIGVITNMTNSGTIQGAGGDGLNNSGTIIDLTNSGIIRSFGMGGQYGITNSGNISALNNTGVISGLTSGLDNNFGATITTLLNATGGSIGGGGTGINNAGTIDTLLNNGQISSSFSTGLFNSGNLGVITNIGQILAPFGNMISNSGGISTLNNLNGGVALTYTGTLPSSYNIIINSSTQFGKLAGSAISGITTFGIYASSSVQKGTYSSVLSGFTSSNLSNTSGTFYGFRWSLTNSSSDIWDLIVTGASTTDTQQSLANTASVLQGTYTLQNSVMVNGFTYDCSLFDKYGICVSAGGRNTTVQAQGINNTSGLLIASYRLSKNNSRIGAWVDQNLSASGPGTVQLGNSTPMIGVFGVWSQRPDGVGAEVKVSAAYGQKNTTITRQIVGLSEAGSGSSQLISQGAQIVAKYGFAVLPDVVVSPYAGVRYTQNNMGGYTEATSSAVTAPLTYSALNTNATTALAGVGASYRGIPKTTLFASAGVETDTNTSNGTYSATGITGLTPVNFNPNPVKTRPTATVGGYYDILKNQRIGVTGIYRQEPFQAVSTTTVLATYTIGL